MNKKIAIITFAAFVFLLLNSIAYANDNLHLTPNLNVPALEGQNSASTDGETPSSTSPNEELPQVHHYFSDVPINHFAYESISKLYDLGAINYRQEHKFMPNAWISRSEFVHMLLLAKGYHAIESTVPVFNDVSSTHPYASYVDLAHRLGIVDGVGNGQFRPGDPVRRDALMKMIITGTGELNVMWKINWTERNQLLARFSDRNTLSEWAEHYFAHALKHQLITGYPDNTLRPGQYTTRAEAAVLIDRFFLKNARERNGLQSLLINDISIPYVQQFTMQATMYSSKQPGLSNYTASGLTTRIGVVSVDRSIIPLGTHLYIEGYGYAVAADTGGAIKGHKIDLYAGSIQEALQFGRQNVVVYILP